MFVLGDLTIFGMFFFVYLYYRALTPEVFNRSQSVLHTNLGVLNTFLLLTSSWFIVDAVADLRAARNGALLARLICASACGVGFICVKIVEYRDMFVHGNTPEKNDFFMYYFMYTGIHLLHLLIGLGLIAYFCTRVRRATIQDVPYYEVCAIFWHMVDLLWIFLFPLLYLVH